jgi:hypothetical protein
MAVDAEFQNWTDISRLIEERKLARQVRNGASVGLERLRKLLAAGDEVLPLEGEEVA